ncbi:MAG: glycosyltransferase family 2 protein [Paludibacter sp.]|uniref:Glycosyltransferase involved in cell wall bisynthesis n=1 Tax=Flavobacterium frigoris TaxID=229204 RepID=A0A1H9QZ66_FLAFI|nr:glycosyltransferase family A protein [Flavobacterium frigoris]NDP22918.1 glycosyltransferase family 2 protein [Paludibacter sp.]SER65677.1 Glycosyltransferase involved in cell wall bisynthesis [Flavobacterium frigoris]
MTKISIIVPCYNQAQYLPHALQSVLDQTYTDWECIIVNDGSPDNTEAVAGEWITKDTRFKYIYQENGGLSSARNAGITIAEGEFILPLDADDRISTDYVVLAIAEFKKDSCLKVVYCKAEKFGDETGEWLLPRFNLQRLCIQNLIFCSGIYRKSDWKRVGGYDTNMVYGLEDWEFWIAILKDGGNVFRLDSTCFFYRVKGESMITVLNSNQLQISKEIVWHKHVAFIVISNEYLLNELSRQEKTYEIKLKSEKFIINLLTQKFFGFTLFKF